MQWPTTLVIILSVLIAIMLVFWLVVAGLIIMILQRLNRLTKQAEAASHHWVGYLRSFGKKVAPAAASAGAAMFLRRLKSRRGRDE